MRHHLLERDQRVARPPAEAFELFADARRLEAITPPWLALARLLFVRRDLERTFDFRRDAVQRLVESASGPRSRGFIK